MAFVPNISSGSVDLGQLFGPLFELGTLEQVIDADALFGPIIPEVVIQAVIDP